MSFYFSGGQRPTSSPTQGPLVDSVRQLTFTDSRGQTSGYSIWAAHIDPDEPVGMLVHLHGDGGYEYKNDPDSWYLTGPTGILTLAQARNMILVIPFTPDREVDEINSETWWEDIVPHVGWAMELTQSLLDTYSVDMGRLWFSGFSGGAEAVSHQVIPHHLTELGAHAGGFVILGGGGPPYQVTQTVISSPLKARFPITWVVGENDRPEFAYDGYDGRGTAEAGEAAYRTYGWATDLVIVPGKEHLLVDGSQGLYGHYIGQAMDAAPVISYTPGTVTELYLGDRPCELYLGSDDGEPIDPERVTVTTNGDGWFDPDTPVSSPLVSSITDWLLVTAAPVVSTVTLRDWEQEILWEPGEVIPAGSTLYVPPEVSQGFMQVILMEPHDTAHYPQAVVGLAGPGEWETKTEVQWQRVVDEAVDMGMKWIRVTAPWKLIEPNRGVRDWSALDSRISACTTAGLQPLVLILGQPDWAQGIHTTQTSAMSGWSDFCTALADRYQGQVTAYEVWNEPNLDRFWDGANATTYVELLKAASTAIRGADSSALIVSGGLAPATTVAGEATEPLAFLQSVLDGASSHLDHVGWHPYCWPDRPLSGTPWSTWTKMYAAHQKMVSAGVTGQLWLTEYGMPTDGGEGSVTEQEQAEYLVEGIRYAALESHIGPLFVYCLDDGAAGGGTEGYFGLIREDGTPKPARAVVSSETRRSVVRWVKVWPTQEERETVQITLGTGYEAQTQLQATLTARGLNYQTVTEMPFDIELVGRGSAREMFSGCSSLTTVPEMDTSQVTAMDGMFLGCSSLTHVPEMDTSQVTVMNSMFDSCSSLTHVPDMETSNVTNMAWMFYNCSSLTDGNVRLIGKHPNVDTANMIYGSGLTREPFYTTDGQPWPTIEVHEVSVSGLSGENTAHPLVTVTVPAGETWSVRVQGTMQSTFSNFAGHPTIRIGSSTSSSYGNNAAVDYSGTITSTNRTIALVTPAPSFIGTAGFTGTVTIEK